MFDFTQVEEQKDFEPIPQGFYPVEVKGIEWKTSKAGAEYMNVQFSITGENYANRRLFQSFNIFHEKEKVRNIALGELKKIFICSEVDVSKLKGITKEDLVEVLSECKLQAKVSIKMDSQYGDRNEIKGWKALPTDVSKDVPF